MDNTNELYRRVLGKAMKQGILVASEATNCPEWFDLAADSLTDNEPISDDARDRLLAAAIAITPAGRRPDGVRWNGDGDASITWTVTDGELRVRLGPDGDATFDLRRPEGPRHQGYVRGRVEMLREAIAQSGR